VTTPASFRTVTGRFVFATLSSGITCRYDVSSVSSLWSAYGARTTRTSFSKYTSSPLADTRASSEVTVTGALPSE